MNTPTLTAESAQPISPEIEAATKAYTFEFSIYVFLVLGTALVLAVFTWRVWRAGNNLQDAIKRDADARIAEARNSAASAHERTQKLEHDNLKLREEVEARTTQLAVEQQKLEKEQQKTAQAQKEAADAQLALQEHLEQVARRQSPRTINGKRFVAALKGKPKAKVEILYRQNDVEAWGLAIELRRWLGPGQGDGVGWDVVAVKPIPSEGGDPRVLSDAPPTVRHGASNGLGLIVNKLPEGNPFVERERETSRGALVEALLNSGLSPIEQKQDRALPKDFIIIVVGQKP
jgi:hypothetical protein